MHTEEFQFIDRTHTDKEEALENKSRASGWHRRACDAAFRTAAFSFRELARYHEAGMTFRRIPYAGRTRFMFLDIDAKQNPGIPPVDAGEMDRALSGMGYADYRFTHSTSGTPGNWHVFLLLDTPVDTSGAEYGRAHDAAALALFEAVMANRGLPDAIGSLCDPAMRSPNQLLYGCPRAYVDSITVSGMSSPHLERTIEFPSPRWVDTAPDVEPGWNCRRVPTSPGELARNLREAGIIPDGRLDMEWAFSAWLPYRRKGGSKEADRVPEGERHRVLNRFAYKLYCCYRAANLCISGTSYQPYTEEDLKGTFLALAKGACDGDAGGAALKKATKSLMGLVNRGRALSDADWCRGEARYAIEDADGSPRHRFRTSDHCRVASMELLGERLDCGVARFASREELAGELSSRGVTEQTFRRYARASGISVEVAGLSRGGRPRKNPPKAPGGSRGRPREVSLGDVLGRISGTLRENTVEYSGEVSGRDKKFLQRLGYRIKKLKGHKTGT